jgi:hypothetical protein
MKDKKVYYKTILKNAEIPLGNKGGGEGRGGGYT